MNHHRTLPSIREQARHALLLLGAPTPARRVVRVHRALFDGDLDMAGLAGLLRSERVAAAPLICHGLTADLAATHVALAEWPLDRRIVTPAAARAGVLAAVVRVAEFVAMRAGAGRDADRLLRELAQDVPGGPEAVDVGEAAREALADPSLTAAVEAERALRESVAVRVVALDPIQRLFGVPGLPHQRNRR